MVRRIIEKATEEAVRRVTKEAHSVIKEGVSSALMTDAMTKD